MKKEVTKTVKEVKTYCDYNGEHIISGSVYLLNHKEYCGRHYEVAKKELQETCEHKYKRMDIYNRRDHITDKKMFQFKIECIVCYKVISEKFYTEDYLIEKEGF